MADKVLENLRIELKNGLTEAIIKNMVDDLRREEVLNKDAVEEILQKMKARPDQARDLIDSVQVKGKVASLKFFNSLEKHDKCLYDELHICRLLEGFPGCAATSSVPQVTQDKRKNKKEYKMDSIPRGLCVIINNVNFIDPEDKRKGSDLDAASLKEVFTFLGFVVEIHKDLTAEEIKLLMRNYSQDDRLKHMDCFVCCVLSHGNKDGILGKEKRICSLKDIKSPFNAVNCSSLHGKPKVFFIQACRGDEMQSRVVVGDALGGKPDQKSNIVLDKHSIASDSDFLVVMSTVEGCYSIRDESMGSWFIQSLCKHLRDGSQRNQDILSILIEVNHDVSREEGIVEINDHEFIDAKMVPNPHFTLTETLIFKVPERKRTSILPSCFGK